MILENQVCKRSNMQGSLLVWIPWAYTCYYTSEILSWPVQLDLGLSQKYCFLKVWCFSALCSRVFWSRSQYYFAFFLLFWSFFFYTLWKQILAESKVGKESRMWSVFNYSPMVNVAKPRGTELGAVTARFIFVFRHRSYNL